MNTNERRRKSTEALNHLIKEVIEKPSEWIEDTAFIVVLKSQGRLAHFESAERKIHSCSLNTLKSSADEVLDDGFVGLDLRRINALKEIEWEISKEQRPKRGSRAALKERVNHQAKFIVALEARNMTLTYYIRELQSLANEVIYSKASKAALVRLERSLEVIHSKLSFSGESELTTLKFPVNE